MQRKRRPLDGLDCNGRGEQLLKPLKVNSQKPNTPGSSILGEFPWRSSMNLPEQWLIQVLEKFAFVE